MVIGVFMGFQVNNWNEGRKDRALDGLYMERLHDEIETADRINSVIAFELATNVSYISETMDLVSNEKIISSLSRNQCDAVFSSHIYRPGRVSFPTMDELIASGRASVISKDTLRKSILRLSQLRSVTAEFNARISADAIEIHREYPNMIWLNNELTNDRFGVAPYGGHRCFPKLMQRSAAFKNDLIDNLYRMDSYIKLANQPELEVLADIHVSLDLILAIKH